MIRAARQSRGSLWSRVTGRIGVLGLETVPTPVAVETPGDPGDDYRRLKGQFVANGKRSRFDSWTRARLVDQFERIDTEITGRTPIDALVLAEMLMNLDGEGGLVQCGDPKAGMAAKLSLVAAQMGRRLFVLEHGAVAANEGMLEEVEEAIAWFGNPSVCRFIAARLHGSLVEILLPKRIALAMVEAAAEGSVREGLTALWPRVSDRGLVVARESAWADGVEAAQGLTHNLRYFIKGSDVPAEYHARLTIEKSL